MDTAKLEAIRVKIKRWQSRATRANNMLAKLYRQESRALRAVQSPAPGPNYIVRPTPPPPAPEPELSIPDFLKQNPADKKAADAIKAEIDAKKKIKTKARLEKMKLRRAGELKRMPLTGKAALEFIRQA